MGETSPPPGLVRPGGRDNNINQVYIKRCSRVWGIQVIVAENGRHALKILKKVPVDLVLMDIQMPIMDGYTAIKKIRELDSSHKGRSHLRADRLRFQT